MRMSRVGLISAVAAFGMVAAAPANAANQGSLGATSQGDLTITLTVDALVQISDLDDIPLGTFDGSKDLTGSDNVCVYSNNGGFNITATGSGASSAFTLAGGGTTVPYTVEWANSSGATSGTEMFTGRPLNGQTAKFAGADCGGSTNTTVLVSVSQTDLSSAPADAYAGVLTLLVAPQ
jgi:hypothetical protein